MNSKELNEILNKTRRAKEISLTPKQIEEIIKDLGRLECIENVLDNIANRLKLEVKNIFTLETEIFNRLEVLEILKKGLENAGYIKIFYFNADKLEIHEIMKVRNWLNGKD